MLLCVNITMKYTNAFVCQLLFVALKHNSQIEVSEKHYLNMDIIII